MINNMPAHWDRLTRGANDVMTSAARLRDGWSTQPPISPEEVEAHEELVLDLRDVVSHLWSELLFLRGHHEGMTQRLEEVKEEANDRGDIIVSITPGTAPCSEIAQSFGVSTAKIVVLARKLGLKPSGEVVWELADGSLRRARTYSLAQWKEMHKALVHGLFCRSDHVTPPARIDIDSEEA